MPTALDQYAALVAAYLFPKTEDAGFDAGPDAPEEEGDQEEEYPLARFERLVRASFDEHYGEFITHHLLDIAAVIAPTARLIDGGLHDVLFEVDLRNATAVAGRFARFDPPFSDDVAPADAEAPENDGTAIMTPSMLSLVWTLAALGLIESDENFAAPTAEVRKFANRWLKPLSGTPQGKPLALDVICAFYAWRFNIPLWLPAMRRVADFPYRDLMQFLCDAPNRELGFYAAFAQLAYPAHGNLREARRFRYVAEGRETPMFMDVIAFDECRYVYDWLSAVHKMPDDWYDVSAQLTFRFALDGIVKERQGLASDFLLGCHAIGIGDARPDLELADRTDLSPDFAYGS